VVDILAKRRRNIPEDVIIRFENGQEKTVPINELYEFDEPLDD